MMSGMALLGTFSRIEKDATICSYTVGIAEKRRSRKPACFEMAVLRYAGNNEKTGFFAEKPSVARELASCWGSLAAREKRVPEGTDYVVTWALGQFGSNWPLRHLQRFLQTLDAFLAPLCFPSPCSNRSSTPARISSRWSVP
jgi:hypothetical protein